jgi:hypothetical protein
MSILRRKIQAEPGDFRCGWCLKLFGKRSANGKLQIKRGEEVAEFNLKDRSLKAWCRKCKQPRLITETT